jgi:hypothetical protein
MAIRIRFLPVSSSQVGTLAHGGGCLLRWFHVDPSHVAKGRDFSRASSSIACLPSRQLSIADISLKVAVVNPKIRSFLEA